MTARPARRGRTVARPAAAIVLGLATIALWPAAAAAHANLASSDPADGAQLDAAPAEIALTFTETPDLAFSSVQVLDATGSAVGVGDLAAAPGDARTVSAPITGSLPDGTYTVSWRVVSQEDGHTTAGAFAFGIGEPPNPTAGGGPATPQTPGASPLAVAAKVLLYGGLAVLLAAAGVGLWALAGDVPARRLVLIAAGLTALVGSVLLMIAEAGTLDVGVRDLAGSATGALFVRLVVATTVAALLATTAALVPGWGTLALAGAAAAAAMLIRAQGGHAAATSLPWIEVGLQWFHFLAVGLWIGGLFLVLLYLRARRPHPPPEPVRRYSRLAGYALAVVVLTGLLRATSEQGIGWWTRALDTAYGTTLLTKVAVVAGLIGLGAWNRYRSIPRLADRPGMLRRVMTIEVVGAVGVFSLTGLLTSLPPEPSGPAPTPAAARIVAEGSDFATTMRIRLIVSPGSPGPNRFDLRIADFDSGEPLPVDRASLRLDTPSRPEVAASRLELDEHGDRWVAQGTQLSLPGVWVVTASIERGAEGTEIPLTLVVPSPGQRETVSEAPGQPTLHLITTADGSQAQVYLDPGAPGPAQLHLTTFDAQGAELPLADVRIVAVTPDGAPVTLDAERFSAGHFIASVTLTPGRWTFVPVARTRAGDALTVTVEQDVGA
jgi:copper transport protein